MNKCLLGDCHISRHRQLWPCELLNLSRIVAISLLNPICTNCNSKKLPVLLQAARVSLAHFLIKFLFTPAFPTGLLINKNLKRKEDEMKRRGRKFARWTNEGIQNYRVELYLESVFNVWRHFKTKITHGIRHLLRELGLPIVNEVDRYITSL